VGGGATGIQDDLRHLDDIGRQSSAANRILGDELEQRRVPEVVAAFERDVLRYEIGVSFQMGVQAFSRTAVKKLDSSPKNPVPDALMGKAERLGVDGRGFTGMTSFLGPGAPLRAPYITM
jgi:hypothetical protein